MTDCFTGFWETRYTAVERAPEVATTMGPVDVDTLLERLRERLLDVPAGTWVRIDLIAWDS